MPPLHDLIARILEIGDVEDAERASLLPVPRRLPVKRQVLPIVGPDRPLQRAIDVLMQRLGFPAPAGETEEEGESYLQT